MTALERVLRKAVGHSAIRRGLCPPADALLERYVAWRMRGDDIRQTVALVSTGRGEPTRLAGQVTSLPNRTLTWGALHLVNNSAVRHLGVDRNTYPDPEATAQRIFEDIGQSPAPDIAARIRRPGATTNARASYDSWKKRLVAWRRALPADDPERVHAMAHRLGVTCYGADPRPDLSLSAPAEST